MNNSSKALTTLFAAAAALVLFASPLQAQQFEEGVHYERISGPDVADTDGVVEVVEIFSYTCPACKNFEAYLGPWHEELVENVEFSRVSIGPEPLVRSYYTAEVLDILEQSHHSLFTALHDERMRLRTMGDLAEFHARFGVDAEQFESTASSFPVESRMRMGNASAGKWRVRSTPTMVINGKYRVSPRRGGTYDEMLQVVDMLVDRELETAEPSDS